VHGLPKTTNRPGSLPEPGSTRSRYIAGCGLTNEFRVVTAIKEIFTQRRKGAKTQKKHCRLLCRLHRVIK